MLNTYFNFHRFCNFYRNLYILLLQDQIHQKTFFLDIFSNKKNLFKGSFSYISYISYSFLQNTNCNLHDISSIFFHMSLFNNFKQNNSNHFNCIHIQLYLHIMCINLYHFQVLNMFYNLYDNHSTKYYHSINQNHTFHIVQYLFLFSNLHLYIKNNHYFNYLCSLSKFHDMPYIYWQICQDTHFYHILHTYHLILYECCFHILSMF